MYIYVNIHINIHRERCIFTGQKYYKVPRLCAAKWHVMRMYSPYSRHTIESACLGTMWTSISSPTSHPTLQQKSKNVTNKNSQLCSLVYNRSEYHPICHFPQRCVTTCVFVYQLNSFFYQIFTRSSKMYYRTVGRYAVPYIDKY